MKRRAFLEYAERAVTAILCAGVSTRLLGCSGANYVTSIREQNRLIVRREAIGDASYVLVTHADLARPVFVHRQPDGSYAAVSTRCMHRGCQVEPAGDRLTCPCHGSQYRLTGEVLRGPTERPLERYELHTEGELLYIELGELL